MEHTVTIVTPHSVFNYGALLQAYGLFYTVRDMGCDAAIYDFPLEQRKAGSVKEWIYILVGKMFRTFHSPSMARGDRAFREFMKHYTVSRDEDSRVYIAGSDQVWNPYNLNEYFTLNRFKSAYKISYAASIGLSTIPESEMGKYSFLHDFKGISVREKTARTALYSVTGKGLQVHVDPSLLLTAEQWRGVEKKADIDISSPYILLYVLHIPSNIREIIRDLKRTYGCRVVLLDRRGYLNWLIPCDTPVRDAGPAEFIWLVDHARFIVTTSFHGTVFSVMFHKEFLSILNPASPSRIQDLLQLLQISGRDVLEWKNQDLSPIDYERVDKVLDQERARSRAYMRNHFKEAGIHAH